MNKSVFFRVVILLTFVVAGKSVYAEQPNVLWIGTDDQRYDSIQAFNRMLHDRDHNELGHVESPNVDRLAKMGTTFINIAMASSLKDKPLSGVLDSDRIEVDWGKKGEGTKVFQRDNQ